MEDLISAAKLVADRLIERGESLAVAESSSGGLISAALLAQPGASRWFLGASVVYTARARHRLLGLTRQDVTGMRSASAAYAALIARRACAQLDADWGLGESGAAGPDGNGYGDPPGHACVAVAGVREAARTLSTGRSDRFENMTAFAQAALSLLSQTLA